MKQKTFFSHNTGSLGSCLWGFKVTSWLDMRFSKYFLPSTIVWFGLAWLPVVCEKTVTCRLVNLSFELSNKTELMPSGIKKALNSSNSQGWTLVVGN